MHKLKVKFAQLLPKGMYVTIIILLYACVKVLKCYINCLYNPTSQPLNVKTLEMWVSFSSSQ